MKSIHQPIAVDADAENRVPRCFRWDNRTYRVRRLLDYWILQTRWWGREEKRIYYRLETTRGVVEIYRAAESSRAGRASKHPDRTSRQSDRTSPQPGRSNQIHSKPSDRPPLPIEGDTHTRERRLVDAPHRPDVRIAEELRREAAAGGTTKMQVRWMLSKILD